MPYIVLEAAAACVPMVATAVGGIPEIFRAQSDRLVPAGDPAALADAMERLDSDPGLRRTEADALRETVRAVHTVEAMAASVEAAYREALPARRLA
jgi:glycosyltransferase involved in cell wall biosynthesis